MKYETGRLIIRETAVKLVVFDGVTAKLKLCVTSV